MKNRCSGRHRIPQRKGLLLGLFAAIVIQSFAPDLNGAQTHTWDGFGDGVHWSDPHNWAFHSPPQSGDDLVFQPVEITTSTHMVNDIPGLTVRSISFTGLSLFTTIWVLDGNDLSITGDISVPEDFYDMDVHINCGLILKASTLISLNLPDSTSSVTLRLNGPVDLHGHNLDVVCNNTSDLFIQSAISGVGNLNLVSADRNHSPLIVFSGSLANTFTGALNVSRFSADSRPPHVQLNHTVGPAVNTQLVIGDGCEVSLGQPEQIGDDAVVSITGGGRLLLNGRPETLGSLLLTNTPVDTDSTFIDASGTTLSVRGSITTDVSNDQGSLPTIKGTLGLPPGLHLFDLHNTALGSDGLRLQAQISGAGGFIKAGSATLSLTTSNDFRGAVQVSEGILDVFDAHAFGSTSSGVTMTDGSIRLHKVRIDGETLFVRGTKPVTANTIGSLLNCVDAGGWVGRIELDTNLAIYSGDLCFLGGPIVGSGGIEFLGSRHQTVGSGSSKNPSTYTGPVRVLCDLLIISDEPAFHGPLIVGGGFSPMCEIRWDSTERSGGVSDVTIHTNGLVNLNGHTQTFAQLTFNGGRVTTGAGVLAVDRVVTNPTNVSATIDGNLRLSSSPTTPFIVGDGAATVDLAILATISDGFNDVGIEKTGEGEMDLYQANTYRGPTLVQAGKLSILNNNALGATFRGTTVANGATVAFGIQADTVLEPFTIAGSGVGGTEGALVTVADTWINTNIVLSGAATIRTEGANSRIQVNDISGIGSLTKTGSGRLVLRGGANNSYLGDTVVTEGVLALAKPATIAAVPGHLIIGTNSNPVSVKPTRVEQGSSFSIVGSVTVNAGGLWDLAGQSEGFDLPNLQGRPPVTLNGGGSIQTGSGIFFLPVGGDIVVNPGLLGSSTISGRIGLDPGTHHFVVGRHTFALASGPDCNVTAAISETSTAADLQKQGTGLLRLAATNSHRGTTLISGGTLQLDGVQPQSLVSISDGGRLQGVGVAGSIELLGPTATVAPGSGPGLLTCNNFILGTVQHGVLQIELNGPGLGAQYDQVSARGTVNLTGLTLQAFLGFTSSVGQQFTIINNDGVDPIIGTFDGLPQNASFSIGGERFSITYTGGTGNDVVLTRLTTPQVTVTTLPATEVPNHAVDFDGEDDRVQVSTNAFPNLSNTFTIELWANPTASRLATPEADKGISDITSQRYAIFPDQGDFGYGPGHVGVGLSIGTNGISVFEHGSNHLPSVNVNAIPISGWTHVALVYANRRPTLYVNGELLAVGAVSAKPFVHPSASLGGSIQGPTYGNFRGQLDEVRIWNSALSLPQIQTNRNRTLTGSESGLVLYYRCDDTNGVSLTDSATAVPNLVGTLTNGAAMVLSGAIPPDALNGPAVTLNSMVVPGGLDSTVWFEWGATTNYGNLTPAQAVGNGFRNISVSQTLEGLAAGTYQFRAVGSNGLATFFGLNQTFTLLHGPPLLGVEAESSGQVHLIWPTNSTGFSLQSTTNLNSPHWSATSALSASVVGTNNVVIDAAPAAQRFYRLFRP